MKTRAMTSSKDTQRPGPARVRSSWPPPASGSRTCLASAGEECASALRALPDWPRLEEVLVGIADQSPFLWGLARRDPGAAAAPAPAIPGGRAGGGACAGLPPAMLADCTEAQAMSLLRKAKQETALIVALADLAGEFDVVAATKALSRAADRFVATALRVALRLSGDKLALADPARAGGTIAASSCWRSASMARWS